MQYSTSPQNGTQDATFHHMWTVQVNSLNEQKDIKHICPLWLMTQHNAQVHKFNSEADNEVRCNIMPLYIYRAVFWDRRLEPPTVLTSGYGDSLVVNKGLCTAILLTGCQTLRRPYSKSQTKEGNWFWAETAQQIEYYATKESSHLYRSTECINSMVPVMKYRW